MGGGIGSFVEGLAGGLQQGQKNTMMMQMQNAQVDLIKKEAKAKEAALIWDNLKQSAFEKLTPEQQQAALFPKADDTLESKLKTIMNFMGQGGGQPSPQPSAPPLPFGGGTEMFPLDPSVTQSLPAQIAQGQMGSMGGLGLSKEDLFRGVIKKELGAEPMRYMRTAPVIMPDGNPGTAPVREDGLIDISKAVPAPYKLDTQKGIGGEMAPTEIPVNPYTRQPMGAPIQTGPPPMMQVETPTAGGGREKKAVPLFPGMGGGTKVTGTTAGGVRTELDLLDRPIMGDDVPKWTDGQGNNPPAGWTPRQAQARGFKPAQAAMAAETGGKVVMVAQAIQDIEVAEKLLFPKAGVFNRKLAFGAQADLPEWMVKDSQTVQSALQNAIAAKLRVETGAQANPGEIVNIAKRFFPSGIKDSEQSARNKLTRLKQFMKDGKFVMDPQGRIVLVEPEEKKRKPDLSLGKKRDPSVMTNDELLKALR